MLNSCLSCWRIITSSSVLYPGEGSYASSKCCSLVIQRLIQWGQYKVKAEPQFTFYVLCFQFSLLNILPCILQRKGQSLVEVNMSFKVAVTCRGKKRPDNICLKTHQFQYLDMILYSTKPKQNRLFYEKVQQNLNANFIRAQNAFYLPYRMVAVS